MEIDRPKLPTIIEAQHLVYQLVLRSLIRKIDNYTIHPEKTAPPPQISRTNEILMSRISVRK